MSLILGQVRSRGEVTKGHNKLNYTRVVCYIFMVNFTFLHFKFNGGHETIIGISLYYDRVKFTPRSGKR